MQRVLIFGIGKLYKDKEEYVRKNFEIVGFLDNRADDNGFVYSNTDIQVYNPKYVQKLINDDTKIVLMSYQYISMWKQLRKLGIRGNKILFGISFPPFTENAEALFEKGKIVIKNENIIYIDNQEKTTIIHTHQDLLKISERILRDNYKKRYPMIDAISKMDLCPLSRKFGIERGTSIDRYYIENFLLENNKLIHGDCLEIAENTYTKKYGGDRVDNAYILHLYGWGENAIKGDLVTGEGIEGNKFDCAIITQTLMCIFDIRQATNSIYKMLKKGGAALITVSGISQVSRYDADLWGYYYGFYKDALETLFEPLFGKENVEVRSYGNVKTAIAMLYGMCREELTENDFRVNDEDYPLIVTAVLRKR